MAVLWRSSPLMLIGLLALPLAFVKRRERAGERTTDNGQSTMDDGRYVIVCRPSSIVNMGLPGAAGLGAAVWPCGHALAPRSSTAIRCRSGRRWICWRRLGWRRWPAGCWRGCGAGHGWLEARAVPALGALALAALLLGYDMTYQPYYLSYFNPLLGGGPVAQDLLLVGWGEGLEHVGAWLSARPDRDRGFVLAWIPDTLQPFLPRELRALDIRATTIALRNPAPNYAVVYARGAMREDTPDLAAEVSRTPPLYQLRMYGLDYATVYQVPRPFDTPVGARFDNGLELGGFSQQRVGATLAPEETCCEPSRRSRRQSPESTRPADPRTCRGARAAGRDRRGAARHLAFADRYSARIRNNWGASSKTLRGRNQCHRRLTES